MINWEMFHWRIFLNLVLLLLVLNFMEVLNFVDNSRMG